MDGEGDAEAGSPDFDQNALDQILAVLSPDEDKDSSSPSFPSILPSAPSLIAAKSPAMSNSGSPFVPFRGLQPPSGGSPVFAATSPALSISSPAHTNIALQPAAAAAPAQPINAQSPASSAFTSSSSPVLQPALRPASLMTQHASSVKNDKASPSKSTPGVSKSQIDISTSPATTSNNSSVISPIHHQVTNKSISSPRTTSSFSKSMSFAERRNQSPPILKLKTTSVEPTLSKSSTDTSASGNFL